MFIRVLIFSLFSLSLSHVSPANAQPDLTITTGKTVADTGAPGYRFTRLQFTRHDAKHNTQKAYRVNLAIPEAPAPEQGFPLLIMLDGNAALMEVSADLLTELSQSAAPPVLAFLAHDNDLRIDGNARAYDYTPAVNESALSAKEQRPGREYGGADGYLSFITDKVIPAISDNTPVNPEKTGLWGHSYGGIFVLHALFTRPDSFAFYAPVDPSLWWGEGYILSEEHDLLTESTADIKDKSLLVLTGSGGEAKRRPRGDRDAATLAAVYKAREAVPAGETARMVERLKAAGVDAEITTLQGLSHGETLGASLPYVFRQFVR